MRIEKVETFPLLYKVPKPYGDANGPKKYRSCFLIRITTSSGIEGWGECVDWLPTLEKGFQQRIIPLLLGQSATERTALVNKVKKWHQRAASGVSMALTEIMAKKAGLSVCDLWGGMLHNEIPVYASFQSYSEGKDWISKSLALVEQSIVDGFTQVKVKVGGKTLQEDKRHIRELQSNVTGNYRLAIDANQSYDMASARSWQSLLSEWDNWLWFEEPMTLDHIKEYEKLRAAITIPLAGGENLASATQFLPLLTTHAVDILQPDTMHQNGIEGYRETLHLARQFGLRVSSHEFDGGLNRLYAMFAHATLPQWTKMAGVGIEPVEWDYMDNPFTQIVPVKPKDGHVTLPKGLGIGVELDVDIINTYRWDGSTYY